MVPGRPLLVLDTASPLVSVAVGTVRGAAAAGSAVYRTLELRRSSELLLHTVDEVLAEAGCALGELGGCVALQGPGSFTGLRIGLATVLGWHQALGIPATAMATLPVLAAAARDGGVDDMDVVAAVDALRGDWYAARFRVDRSSATDTVVEEPGLVSGRALLDTAPCRLVGFGVARLAEYLPVCPPPGEPGWDAGAGVELVEPPPLAPLALSLAASITWDPARLVRPIYFRPPAVTLPPQNRLPES